jgi:hypothetical protein
MHNVTTFRAFCSIPMLRIAVMVLALLVGYDH